jgi:predicted metal-dependent enzyme (double-stranded beta helix superfamily)
MTRRLHKRTSPIPMHRLIAWYVNYPLTQMQHHRKKLPCHIHQDYILSTEDNMRDCTFYTKPPSCARELSFCIEIMSQSQQPLSAYFTHPHTTLSLTGVQQSSEVQHAWPLTLAKQAKPETADCAVSFARRERPCCPTRTVISIRPKGYLPHSFLKQDRYTSIRTD